MVDINLIGDDQAENEGEDKDQNNKESYEPDIEDSTQDTYMGGGTLDESNYTNVISRGGSKKTIYILVAFCVVLIAVVLYVIYQSGGNKTEPTSKTETIANNIPMEDTVKDVGVEPLEDQDVSVPTLSPLLVEKMVKSYRGINTVGSIMNTIPSNVNFTMITYSDGRFLVEFLANRDSDISSVNSQLQQNLYSADIKLLSRNQRNIRGSIYRQALVNGDVNINQVSENLDISQEPIYLTSAELENQLSSICRQSGLRIKQFDSGVEKTEGEFIILPIKFRASGEKVNIVDFLQRIQTENINISFSKISLIANDVDLTDRIITLVLNISLYRMI